MKPENENPGISKLTPELIRQIEQLYGMGLRDRSVAGFVGVHPSTLTMWITRGRSTGGGLYGELFIRCLKAIAGHEAQFIAKLNEHALGAPTKLAYKKKPDGTNSEELLLDSENKPIVLQEEIKSNPTWIAWNLERRHNIWNKADKYDINISSLENPINDAMPEAKEALALPVPMSKEEQIEMFARAMKRVKDE